MSGVARASGVACRASGVGRCASGVSCNTTVRARAPGERTRTKSWTHGKCGNRNCYDRGRTSRILTLQDSSPQDSFAPHFMKTCSSARCATTGTTTRNVIVKEYAERRKLALFLEVQLAALREIAAAAAVAQRRRLYEAPQETTRHNEPQETRDNAKRSEAADAIVQFALGVYVKDEEKRRL